MMMLSMMHLLAGLLEQHMLVYIPTFKNVSYHLSKALEGE